MLRSTGIVIRPPPPAMESTKPAAKAVTNRTRSCHGWSIVRSRGRAHPSQPSDSVLSALAFADLFLLLLQLGIQGFSVADELLLELLHRFPLTFAGRPLYFAFEKDLTFGDFGG